MTRGIPWFPKNGDILTGTVKGYATGKTQFGVKPIAEIEEESTGELRTVWLSAAVLRNQFEQQAVTIGSSVGIEYSGKDPEKKYHLYSLIVYAEGDGPDYLAAMGLATPEDERHETEQPAQPLPVASPAALEAVNHILRRNRPPDGFTGFSPMARNKPQAQPAATEPDPFEW
jgi:hypothetical protein